MIAHQGIETLVKFLTPRNDSIKLATPAALAIRNMSNMPDGIKDPDRVADSLLMALQYQDMQVATYVAEINANLTGNQNLKICFTRQNGIERLIQSLNLFQNKHEFTGPILCCLRHLTGQQQDKERVLSTFHDFNGLHRIMEWVCRRAPRSCLKPALGIVKNFAAVPDFHAILRQMSFVEQINKIFIWFCDELDYKIATPDQSVDNVKLIEIIEALIVCMSAFSKTPENRASIRDKLIVENLKKVLTLPSKNIQRWTLVILSELTREMEGAWEIATGAPNYQIIKHIYESNQHAADNSPENKMGKIFRNYFCQLRGYVLSFHYFFSETSLRNFQLL